MNLKREPQPRAPDAPEATAASALSGMSPVAVWVYDGVVATWALHGSLKPHFHTWWYVREGGVDVRWERARVLLKPEDWVFYPVGWRRSYRIAEGTRLISISFELTWPDGRAVLEMDEPLRGGVDEGLKREGERVARAHTDPESGLSEPLQRRNFGLATWLRAGAELHGFAAELIGRALEAGARTTGHQPVDARLRRLTNELAMEPGAGPLPYEKWERELGLSRGQVDRLAKAHLGMTLRTWRDARLARLLRRRLRAGSGTLKELAAELGFVDQAHFNHWVKRHLGASPSGWRRETLI